MSSPTSHLNQQADFFRENIAQWLDECRHDSEASPHQEHLDRLLQIINVFLEQNGQEPLAVETQHIDAKQLGERFVHFLDEINYSDNPYNADREPLHGKERVDYHTQLGSVFQAISEYLDAVDVPIIRRGEPIPTGNGERTKIGLWKKTPSTEKEQSVVETDAIDLSKKVLICCGGTTSIHGYPPHGFLRLVQGKVGGSKIHDQGVELYSVFYPVQHRASFFADTHQFNANPSEHCSQAAKDFLHQFILPAIEDINPPNTEKLKDTLSHLSFFTYSYGTVFLHELRNELRTELRERGYQPDDIKEALATIYTMNIGPTCCLDDDPSDNFSSVYVLSPNDLSAQSKSDNCKLLDDMVDSDNKIKSIGEHQLLICSEAPTEGKIIEKRVNGNGHGAEQKDEVEKNPSGHGLKFYALSASDLRTMNAHMPRYFRYYLSSILGLDLGLPTPQMTLSEPPKELATFASPEGKIDSHQLAILAEMANKENVRRK